METSKRESLIAQADIKINAPVARVWDALVNPEIIKHYMFGTDVVSDWQEGSSILWRGEWKGQPYEDKGTILQLKPEHIVQYSHFSPLAGQPDISENYHIVTVELSPEEHGTCLSLSQDNNLTEKDRDQSAEHWKIMLNSLKDLLEA